MSELSGIDVEDIEIAIEYNDRGHAVRVIVYVNDETSAKKIETSLNDLEKGKSCEKILCETEEVHTRQVSHVLFLSDAYLHPADLLQNSALLLLLLQLFIK